MSYYLLLNTLLKIFKIKTYLNARKTNDCHASN